MAGIGLMTVKELGVPETALSATLFPL